MKFKDQGVIYLQRWYLMEKEPRPLSPGACHRQEHHKGEEQ